MIDTLITVLGLTALVLCGALPFIDWLFFPLKPEGSGCAHCDCGAPPIKTADKPVHLVNLGRHTAIVACSRRGEVAAFRGRRVS